MFTMIMKWPIEAQIIIAVLFSGGLILAIIKGVRIKRKDLSIDFGSSKKKNNFRDGYPVDKDGKEISPHAYCPYNADAMLKIEKLLFHFDSRRDVRNEAIARQMDAMESYLDELKARMSEIYLFALSEKNIEDPVGTKDYKSYLNIIEIICSRMKGVLREYVRINGFHKMNETDFRHYVDEKKEILSVRVSAILNDIYYYNMNVSRADLYEYNKSKEASFGDLVEKAFSKCRKINMDYEKKLQEHLKGINDFFDYMTNKAPVEQKKE